MMEADARPSRVASGGGAGRPESGIRPWHVPTEYIFTRRETGRIQNPEARSVEGAKEAIEWRWTAGPSLFLILFWLLAFAKARVSCRVVVGVTFVCFATSWAPPVPHDYVQIAAVSTATATAIGSSIIGDLTQQKS